MADLATERTWNCFRCNRLTMFVSGSRLPQALSGGSDEAKWIEMAGKRVLQRKWFCSECSTLGLGLVSLESVEMTWNDLLNLQVELDSLRKFWKEHHP